LRLSQGDAKEEGRQWVPWMEGSLRNVPQARTPAREMGRGKPQPGQTHWGNVRDSAPRFTCMYLAETLVFSNAEAGARDPRTGRPCKGGNCGRVSPRRLNPKGKRRLSWVKRVLCLTRETGVQSCTKWETKKRMPPGPTLTGVPAQAGQAETRVKGVGTFPTENGAVDLSGHPFPRGKKRLLSKTWFNGKKTKTVYALSFLPRAHQGNRRGPWNRYR